MLNKALDAGQITVIEYITEIGVLYQNYSQMQLQLERDYNLITANFSSGGRNAFLQFDFPNNTLTVLSVSVLFFIRFCVFLYK